MKKYIVHLLAQTVLSLFAFTLNAEILDKHESVNIPSRTAQFEIRTPRFQSTNISSVKIGAQTLPKSSYEWQSYKDYGVTAYVFLFDLSETEGAFESSRQKSLENLSFAVFKLMGESKDRQRFGVYTYSDKFSEAGRLPQNPQKVIVARANLKCNKNNFSPVLFEALSKSISKIGAYKDADRRVVCVLGTGKSSDVSYTLEGVLKEAKAGGVIICAAGLADKEAEKPNLQRFAVLAEETGGKFYTKSSMSGDLSLSGMFDEIETGGRITVKIPSDLKGEKLLSVTLESGDTLSMDLSAFLNVDEPKPKAESADGALKEISEFAAGLANLDDLKKSLDEKSALVKKSLESLSETAAPLDLSARANEIEKNIEAMEGEISKIDGQIEAIKNMRDKFQNFAKDESVANPAPAKSADAAKSIKAHMEKFAENEKRLESLKKGAREVSDGARKAINQAAAKNIKNADPFLKRLEAVLNAKAGFEKIAKENQARLDNIGEGEKPEDIESAYNSAVSAAGELEKKLAGFNKEVAEIEAKIKDIEARHKILKAKGKLSDAEKSESAGQDEVLKKASELLAAAKSGVGAMQKSAEAAKDASSKIKDKLDASIERKNRNRNILIFSACGLAAFIILIAVFILARNARAKRLAVEREMEMMRIQEEERRQNEEIARSQELSSAKKYGSIQMVDASSTVYDITKQIFRIGRKSENDISFSNDSVSGYHAEINIKDGLCHLIDLNSTNGTYVNGKRIQSCILNSGDLVELGSEVKFKIHI